MNDYTDFDEKRRFGQTSTQKKRPAFEVDTGRIVHSGAFRRLQGKTQVIGVGERDFYRTRLTHSIEAAQLGRGMCQELESEDGFRPNADLVEAICLAHDIGHPPFGHSGEQFLHKVMYPHGGFGANPQNLRVVAFLEVKYLKGGLDLTRATLDGLAKYPQLFSAEHHKDTCKFIYREDQELLTWIKEGIQDPTQTPIEGQIADWADQVAYSVNDIEDTLRAGLLDLVEMRVRAAQISDAARAGLAKDGLDDVSEITSGSAIQTKARELQERLLEPSDYRVRKAHIKEWTSETIKELMRGCRIKSKPSSANEKSVRYRYSLLIPGEARALAAVLQAAASVLVFSDPRVTTLEYKGGQILQKLFEVFRGQPSLLPFDFQQLVHEKRERKERLVADFVAGMTDRYAFEYYSRLFEPGSGSFYQYV